MVTQEFRPKTFKEVAGQKSIVDTLKCIAKNPECSPRTIILQGEFGTGKTTCARILARALNCQHAVDGEPCGNCPVCNSDLDISPFYAEYDSAIIGNVESIRDLRDTFYFNSDTGYRVVVLDECHLISKAAQAALLKVFEETKGNIFFVLCTTDAQSLLPTIRSRSLELRFNLIPSIYLKENIKGIAEKKGLSITEDILDIIVERSGGHARNAQMLLDRYILLGDTFKDSIIDNKQDFVDFFSLCLKSRQYRQLGMSGVTTVKVKNAEGVVVDKDIKDLIEKSKEKIAELIYKLQCSSLVNLKADYESTVLDILKVSLGVKQSENKRINEFAEVISKSRDSFLQYYRILTDDVILQSFSSDKMFQAAMWVLYTNI